MDSATPPDSSEVSESDTRVTASREGGVKVGSSDREVSGKESVVVEIVTGDEVGRQCEASKEIRDQNVEVEDKTRGIEATLDTEKEPEGNAWSLVSPEKIGRMQMSVEEKSEEVLISASKFSVLNVEEGEEGEIMDTDNKDLEEERVEDSDHSERSERLVSVAEEKKQELYIECALYINGAPFGLPMRTRLHTTGSPYCWNELITLSSKYRDLTVHSQLAITVSMGCFFRKTEGLIGGATILLFNSKMHMKSGKQKLRLWQGKEADGSFPTSTPGKVPRHECGELERLEKLMNKFERGQIQSIDWLDRLMLNSLDKIKEQEISKHGNSNLYLVIDFCSFEHRVVFQESGANVLITSPIGSTNEFVTVWDTELGKFNPSEHKQLKLARSLDRGIIDRDLKPSNAERKCFLRLFAHATATTVTDMDSAMPPDSSEVSESDTRVTESRVGGVKVESSDREVSGKESVVVEIIIGDEVGRQCEASKEIRDQNVGVEDKTRGIEATLDTEKEPEGNAWSLVSPEKIGRMLMSVEEKT
ncbi:hypothetical protein DY000_02050382 [Brassica cretica]|uniref:C2 PI3K-type domain-containing protein n=2 Tax=Brassica cretica TaxID=69181 RepID=A0ABQ7F3I1_BRACR|nr:hypothetical protein DY000_02050382 [Brassica cretica]